MEKTAEEQIIQKAIDFTDAYVEKIAEQIYEQALAYYTHEYEEKVAAEKSDHSALLKGIGIGVAAGAAIGGGVGILGRAFRKGQLSPNVQGKARKEALKTLRWMIPKYTAGGAAAGGLLGAGIGHAIDRKKK